MFDTTVNFLLLVLGFGLMIFIHEAGHFLAAKWAGIRVLQFAIGFGPPVCSWRKGIGFRAGGTEAEVARRVAAGEEESTFGETEYRINWLPLGGYVKMLGQEDLDVTATSDDPRSYTAKPVGKRMVVVCAGVVMNLILAAILFVWCFTSGVEMLSPIVGSVAPTAQAAKELPTNAEELGITRPGLMAGDLVLTVNDWQVKSFQDVAMAGAIARSGREVHLTVEREGRNLHFDLLPREDRSTQLLGLGVEATRSNVVGELPEEAWTQIRKRLEAEGVGELNLTDGSELIAINGQPVGAMWQVTSTVVQGDGSPVELTFRHPDETEQTVTMTPRPRSLFAQMHVDGDPTGVMHVLGLCPLVRIVEIIGERSPAAQAGLEPGDVIVRVEDRAYPRQDQLMAAIRSQARSEVRLTVLREGERVEVVLRVGGDGTIGIALEYDVYSPVIASPLPTSEEPDSSPTDDEGVQWITWSGGALEVLPGSRLVSVNGTPISNWYELQVALLEAVQAAGGGEAQVELVVALSTPENPQERLTWTIPAREAEELMAAGWSLGLPEAIFEMHTTIVRGETMLDSMRLGFEETWRTLYVTYLTLDRLFRGSIKVQHLKGPVGIAEIGTKVASQGFMQLVLFLGIISVNLAVINFLPIPIVDGGLFIFLVIEKIKGSPVSERVQATASTIGMVLILTVFVITFYNDIANLLKNFG